MIIEGPILLVILVVVALVIAALGVYVRFAMGRAPAGGDMIFSRLLRAGPKADPEEEAGTAVPEAPVATAAGRLSGIDLPALSGGSLPADPAMDGTSDMKSLLSGFGGGLSGLMSARKNKEKIKEEVKIIDSQLEQVLKQSEAISAPENMPAGMLDMPLSMPDMSLNMPDSMPLSMPESAPMSMPDMPNMPNMPDGMSFNLPDSAPLSMPDMQLTLPDIAPVSEPASSPGSGPAIGVGGGGEHAPIKNSGEGVKKLCKEYVMPDAPLMPGEEGLQLGLGDPGQSPDGKSKSKKSKDAKGKYGDSQSQNQIGDFGGKKADASDDLLKDLEAEVTVEEAVNMSIMKEYADMPITCDEIETDLKGILGNITVNTHGKKNMRM